jgi:hypothetical protein
MKAEKGVLIVKNAMKIYIPEFGTTYWKQAYERKKLK